MKVPAPRALKVTELSGSSLRLQWEAVAASDVVVYQIKWSTASGEKPQEVRAHTELWGGWAGSELTQRAVQNYSGKCTPAIEQFSRIPPGSGCQWSSHLECWKLEGQQGRVLQALGRLQKCSGKPQG